MKKLIGILVLGATLMCSSARATNYYFSASGDDSRTSTQAKNPSTPWKSIAKLNSIFSTLLPGDSVLFKRGEAFFGEIIINKSGTSSQRITLGAYGTGAKPIITGFTTVTSWTSIGSGIYESVISSAQTTLNMVTKNDVFQALGRWPKVTAATSGYLTYQSNSGTTSITSTSLAGAINYTGGEVVLRANHYNLDRGTITSQSSTTINYTMIPGGSINTPLAGYGFFIQNHVKCLTLSGEWCFEPSTKKLKMYFGSASPSSSSIKASVLNNNITVTSKSYLTFVNLTITGSNAKAFNITSSNNILISGCDISNCGVNGIFTNNTSSSITVTGCAFSYINNNAINASSSTYWTIRSSSFTNIGAVAGMGLTGDQQYFGLSYIGPNSLVEYNTLNNIGYTAIHYIDGPVTIQNNFINNFCLVKDDGGGIYTFKNLSSAIKTIKNNIVINGVGAPNGTPSFLGGGAIGLYADGGSLNVQMLNNSVANCQQLGILFNDSYGAVLTGNTVYNCGTPYTGNLDGGGGQVQFSHWSGWQGVRNNNMSNNIFCSKLTVGQATARFSAPDNDLKQFFTTCDYNYYARPLSESSTLFSRVSSPAWLTLAQWQSVTGKESHSKKSPKTTTNMNDLRFEYNATNSSVVVNLGASYMDMKGTTYSGKITLAPYTSAMLIYVSGSVAVHAATAEIAPENSSLAANKALSIYPNPATNNFTLEMNNAHMGKMNVQIFDQSGALTHKYSFNKDQQTNRVNLAVSDLPPGVYFIQVQVGTWSERRKLLIF